MRRRERDDRRSYRHPVKLTVPSNVRHGRGIIGDWCGVTVKLNTGERVELGDRVTFAFSGVTDNGIPRCPSFVALRDYE
jgi:hypothetical protein